MITIEYERLWTAVIDMPSHRDRYSVHGPDHWKRVERNGCVLATRTAAKIDVVRLFALFHDCRRENDGSDPDHGKRGADFAAAIRGKFFDLPDEDFDLLHYACVWHAGSGRHDDPTIGTCWDADRLDLGRVGMIPDPAYMSTAFGAEIASHGAIQPWLHLADTYLSSSLTRH